MSDARTALVWLRRDLRLDDNPALAAAAEVGLPILAFILDPETEASLGAAAAWRLSRSLASLGEDAARRGGRLILRRGAALPALRALVAECGARTVLWSRRYDPSAIARDSAVKAALRADGIAADSVNGSLLHEPWTVAPQAGGAFRVFGAFARACFRAEVEIRPLSAPDRLGGAGVASDDLADWRLEAGVGRGASALAARARIGEAAARGRLDAFIADGLAGYAENRGRLDRPDGSSGLSPHLAVGEIAPWTAWRAARRAMAADPAAERGGGVFLKELLWREFAWHLHYHFPELPSRNWREGWDAFPWRPDNEDAEAWRRARTGAPLVDAAMREMYVTGVMHNRARMVVASYLTKHLLTDWRVGAAWFRDCLIDWDPASNALGWQWTAGCGPDAAPYFRIFNPERQAETHDPEGAYRRRWIPEAVGAAPGADAAAWHGAIPRGWRQDPAAPYPPPLVDLAAGRRRALAAFEQMQAGG